MPDIASELRAARLPARAPFPTTLVLTLAALVVVLAVWHVVKAPLELALTRQGIAAVRAVTPTAMDRILTTGEAGAAELIALAPTLPTAERAAVIERLATVSGDAVDRFLLESLDDPIAIIRVNAVAAARRRKLTAAAPKLRTLAQNDPTCGEFALLALFTIGGPDAAAEAEPLLTTPLPREEADQVRFLRTFFPALPVLLESKPAPTLERLRHLAAWGFGDPLPELESHDILAALSETDATARLSAIRVIRAHHFNDPQTVKALQRVYLDPRRLYLRAAASHALRALGTELPDIKEYESAKDTNRRRLMRGDPVPAPSASGAAPIPEMPK